VATIASSPVATAGQDVVHETRTLTRLRSRGASVSGCASPRTSLSRLPSASILASPFRSWAFGYRTLVSIGTSIFLIAAGAILRYAVTASVSGLSLATVGLILMLAGILGLVLSLFYLFARRPRRVAGERVVERPPYEPPETY
jgi:Domain of unknown function (DUF6458)